MKTGGVKAINLKDQDFVVSVNPISQESKEDIMLITHRGAVKKMVINEIESGVRAKRGVLTLRELKSNPHRVYDVLLVEKMTYLLLKQRKVRKQ